jgi:hypothetical protein
MSTHEVKISDFSEQVVVDPGEQAKLVKVLVTDHPVLEPDQRAELEAKPDELKDLGRFSIAAVGLEVTFPGDEAPKRHILTKNNFDKLFTSGRPADEVIAAASIVEVVKQRAATRPSHNTTRDGGPLVNYNDPANAGLPHKGKIGDQEAAFVRENLELVNQRRADAGHSPIDPAKPADAKRYGFDTSTPPAPEQPAAEGSATPEQSQSSQPSGDSS